MKKNKEKQHIILKMIIIILSFFMVFGINLLQMLIVKDESNFMQIMLSDLTQIVAIAGVLLLWAKVLPRVFPSVNDFRFRKPTAYQVMMLLGIALLGLVIGYRIIYVIRGGEANVTMAPMIYSKAELKEDMMASIHAILIAPMIEEACFRFIPASVIKTGKNRIIILAVLVTIFAIMHPHNIGGALLDAIIFCVLLLTTKNPLASILCHAFGNFLKTFVGVLDCFSVIDISVAESGGTILLFSIPVTLIFIVIAVVLILPQLVRMIRNKNPR